MGHWSTRGSGRTVACYWASGASPMRCIIARAWRTPPSPCWLLIAQRKDPSEEDKRFAATDQPSLLNQILEEEEEAAALYFLLHPPLQAQPPLNPQKM
ncbi:hypothetical protein HN51_071570, partial [Arachis hypogaea]